MRTLASLVVAVLLVSQVASGQVGVTFETITIADSAIGFTSTTLRPTGGVPMQRCFGKLETAQVRWRYDGTDPTTTIGLLVDIGDVVEISGAAYLQATRFIRTGSVSGVINFQCDRQP